jgi:tetratricopeptide (TPR) repeat protein
MKLRALFVLLLAFLAATSARAQQSTSSPEKANLTSSAAPIAMSPRDAAEMRADVFMARKEYTDAIKSYQSALNQDPKNAALLNKMGVACQQLDDLGRASHFYKKSIKADKTFASAVNNLGTVEYELKHYGRSIGDYKKALAIRQDMPTVYSNLGYAYFANKEYPEAINSFTKALALDPAVFDRKGGTGSIVQQRTATDPGLFYFFVAKTYAQRGDAERAAHYLKLARDDGYKDFLNAETDPAFAKVVKDPRVKEVLVVPPSYAAGSKKGPGSD